VLNPNVPAADVPLVTIVTGLACRDVLSEYCQVETMIKWPNDVYLGGKKLGGILCENQLDTSRMPMVSTVIIGVGMNINSRLHDFPVDLHSTITTLYEHSQRTYDLPHLLDQCVTRIGDMVGALPVRRTEMLARWQQHDYVLNKPLRHIHGSEIVVGVGKGITEDGHYRFVDNGGQERTVLAGQLRPIGETF
jgi:BirA family biotin operon repressor/biotin-[acetyl-CoA-carboxylase] ligase